MYLTFESQIWLFHIDSKVSKILKRVWSQQLHDLSGKTKPSIQESWAVESDGLIQWFITEPYSLWWAASVDWFGPVPEQWEICCEL